jgi:hypothetical protein
MGTNLQRPLGSKQAKMNYAISSSLATYQAERIGSMNRIEASHSRAADAMAHGKSHKANIKMAELYLRSGNEAKFYEFMAKAEKQQLEYENAVAEQKRSSNSSLKNPPPKVSVREVNVASSPVGDDPSLSSQSEEPKATEEV